MPAGRKLADYLRNDVDENAPYFPVGSRDGVLIDSVLIDSLLVELDRTLGED